MTTLFAALCDAHGLPRPEEEYRFHPVRRWRFDYCWPALKVALEVQGGGWVRGRHHRPRGYERDIEKLNEAQLLGWLVLWATPAQLDRGAALAWVKRAIQWRG